MKRLLLLFFIAVQFPVFGQRVQLELSTGYGAGVLKQQLGVSLEGYTAVPGVHYYKPYPTSLGHGYYINAGVKLKTDSISFVSISARYWNSNPVNLVTEILRPDGSYDSYWAYRFFTNNIYLCVAYGFNYKLGRLWNLTARAGFMAGKTFMTEKVTVHSKDNSMQEVNTLLTYKYNYPLNFGLTGGIDLQRKINERWKLTGSLHLQLLNAKPNRKTLMRTEGVITGTVQNYTSLTKEINFYNPVTAFFDSLKPLAGLEEEKSAPISFPMSALFFSVGVSYSIQ